ncbi:DUF3667 domain-containing protein [Flavobacterium sp. Sd200]|uniref:DUF3667 domain-containing protein n=1 Tax=Flavobacterium sp. Sd200 TaxID=2692211 RepID=UPI00136C6286|nr:DUF3667 domain-containing protein [Flavobacterium sp. Sd200]MXN89794.1 DUF3667 domain-containing protein [Flavobacterium sp. Sd200]
MKEVNCLNCGHEITANYCPNCGQKNSTHRYSLKHFLEHDLIHGIWHVDKGALFTIKELFTRPGHSVREYILGKRAPYFSFVTLILLTLAVSTLIGHYSHVKLLDIIPEASREAMSPFEKFVSKNPKIILLVTIPIYSLFSFLWFKKAGFNYSEHLVLNSYKVASELIVGLLFTILTVFYTNPQGLMLINYIFVTGFSILYTAFFYYQFFSKSGLSKRSRIFRSIMVPVSYLLLAMMAGVIWAIATKSR